MGTYTPTAATFLKNCQFKAGACPGGGAQGAWRPLEIEKQKKKAFRFWAPPLTNSWTRACKEHKSQSFVNIVLFTMYKNYQIRHYVVLCSTNFPCRVRIYSCCKL